jgi:succinyl-diaminopimelate desuccinylase
LIIRLSSFVKAARHKPPAIVHRLLSTIAQEHLMTRALLDDLTALTCDLVAFESVAGRADEIDAAIDYAERFARSVPGVTLERVRSNGIPSLWVSLRGTAAPALILNAHLDVVPGRPEQFHPQVRDGRIYGRGSQDMKGSGAVLLRLLRDLAALPEPPDVAFQFVGDEEIGGMDGTRVLLEERGRRCDFFLAAEPSDLQICYAHKGAIWPEVHLKGSPSHGSRPWEGKNPIAVLRTGLATIEERYPTPDEAAWLTTVVPTKIESGDATNRLPSSAVVTFDIRYIPEERPEDVLDALCGAFPGGEVVTRPANPPLYTDPQNPLVQRLAGLITATTGSQAGLYREHFATDARFYSSAGIPAVCVGPVGAGLHSDEEWVDIASLGVLYEILRGFALEIG